MAISCSSIHFCFPFDACWNEADRRDRTDLSEFQQEKQLGRETHPSDVRLPSQDDAACSRDVESAIASLEKSYDSEHAKRTSALETYIEFANALTMLVPPFVVFYYLWLHPNAPLSAWLILVGLLLHMPASISFHIFLIWTAQVTGSAGDSAWLMVDQSCILITGSIWSFALSGDVFFGVTCSVFMAILIVQRWRELHYSQGFGGPWQQKLPSRLWSIFTIMWLYLGGSWIGGVSSALHTLGAACVILLGISIMMLNACGRYSHVIFHLFFIPYAWFIVSAAGEVDRIQTSTARTPSLLLFLSGMAAGRLGIGILFGFLDRRVQMSTKTPS